MAEFNMQFMDYGGFKASFTESQELSAGFGEVQKVSTSNYEDLYNKPQIEGVTLIGNKTLPQIGVELVTEQDIDKILYGG